MQTLDVVVDVVTYVLHGVRHQAAQKLTLEGADVPRYHPRTALTASTHPGVRRRTPCPLCGKQTLAAVELKDK